MTFFQNSPILSSIQKKIWSEKWRKLHNWKARDEERVAESSFWIFNVMKKLGIFFYMCAYIFYIFCPNTLFKCQPFRFLFIINCSTNIYFNIFFTFHVHKTYFCGKMSCMNGHKFPFTKDIRLSIRNIIDRILSFLNSFPLVIKFVKNICKFSQHKIDH